MDAIPIALRATAANGQYSVVIFHRARVDVVFAAFHRLNVQRATPNVQSRISQIRVRASLFQEDERDSAQDRNGGKQITQSKRFAEQ